MENFTIIKENLTTGLKWKNLVRMDHIKSGAFGDVYKYSNSKSENQFFAVKILHSLSDDLKVSTKKVQNEISVLESLSQVSNASAFFPMYYGHVNYHIEKKGEKLFYALVFELGNGNLKGLVDYHRKKGVGLTFKENISLLKCFARGLSYLQRENVSHRDLKPDNIIFFEDENKSVSFKIIDFGEVKINVDEGMGTLTGTPNYFAPEVNISFLEHKSHIDEENYNPFKSDIYSVGLIFLYANLMELPFPKVKQFENSRILEKETDPFKNKKGPFDAKIKEMIQRIEEKFAHCRGIGVFSAILKKCLAFNPKNRMDFLELKNAFHFLKAEIAFSDLEEENNIGALKNINKTLIERNQLLKEQLDEMTNLMLDLKSKGEVEERKNSKYSERDEVTMTKSVLGKKDNEKKEEEIKREDNIKEKKKLSIVNQESFTVFYFSSK